jgi:PAS domain S-box-containing protein
MALTEVASHQAPIDRDQLYRLVARHIPNTALFLLDQYLRILVAEGQALRSSGYDPKNLEGQLITNVLTSPDRNELIEQYREALEGVENEREYHWEDRGSYQVHAIPVSADSNSDIYLMVVATNITEQVKAQQTIANAERRTRALLSALPDAMFVVNRDGIITEVNVQDESTFLFPRDSIGKTISDNQEVRTDIAMLALRALEDAFATRKTQSFEYTIEVDDEDYFFEARTLAVNNEEAITLVRDISAQKRAVKNLTERNHELEILRAFDQDLNQVLSIDYVLDRAIEYLQANSDATCGAILLLRGDALECAIVRGATDEDMRLLLAKCGHLLRGHILAEDADTLVVDFAESTYPSLLPESKAGMLLPIFTGDKPIGMAILETTRTFNPRHMTSMNHMINRLATGLENARLYKQAEQQLIELQALYAKVRKLEQTKTDMIRIASHDLKNPLAGMRGYIEMLRWEATNLLGDDQNRYLNEIAQTAERMQDMVNGILSIDRIEQMANNTLDEQVNIGQMANRIIAEHLYSAKQKSHTLTLQVLTDVTTVSGDLYQLQEAMNNLISNAIKYTPNGGDIDVTVQGQGNDIEFVVRDNGYGVPEQMQPRLFTPFFRAKTKETSQIEGTGLGLNLVKNIVERHNGRVIFQSERGKGSTFGFALPLVNHAT